MGRFRRKPKTSRGSKKKRSSVITEVLLDVAEDVARLFERVPYRGIPYEQVLAIERGKDRRRRREAIAKLKTQKLIKIVSVEGNMMIGLTKSGEMRVIREKIQWCRTTLPEPERCIVVFDIPAIADNARRAFLTFLKRAHFKRLQFSVYSTTNEVFDLLAEFVRRSKIQRWVTILHVKKQT